MAGHSQYSNIMHRKGRQDAKRAKIFTKIGREITVAARQGGPEPAFNPRLRAAILWAREENMTNDRIKKAIDTATGAGADDNYEEVSYEGYGPGGVAIIVDALTNNRNRTAGDVRSTFSKYGGNLGETNSVRFMFDRIGEISYKLKVATPDAMFEAAVEAGADDCQSDEEHHIIQTATDQLGTVLAALEAKFGDPEKSAFVWKPNIMSPLDEEQAKTIMKLIDVLEDNDDVQTVTTNFEVSDDVMQKLMAG